MVGTVGRNSRWVAHSVVIAVGIVCSQSALAAVQYEFVQRDTGNVLAFMDLTGVEPFVHDDVASLAFTAAGNAVLGLGVGSYSGILDSTSGSVVSDGSGGLTTANPPDIAWFSEDDGGDFWSVGHYRFSMGFYATESADTIEWMFQKAGELEQSALAVGIWTSPTPGVPEPSSLAVFAGLAGIAAHGYRRKKRRA